MPRIVKPGQPLRIPPHVSNFTRKQHSSNTPNQIDLMLKFSRLEGEVSPRLSSLELDSQSQDFVNLAELKARGKSSSDSLRETERVYPSDQISDQINLSPNRGLETQATEHSRQLMSRSIPNPYTNSQGSFKSDRTLKK